MLDVMLRREQALRPLEFVMGSKDLLLRPARQEEPRGATGQDDFGEGFQIVRRRGAQRRLGMRGTVDGFIFFY